MKFGRYTYDESYEWGRDPPPPDPGWWLRWRQNWPDLVVIGVPLLFVLWVLHFASVREIIGELLQMPLGHPPPVR
jgi:hypothetical protein